MKLATLGQQGKNFIVTMPDGSTVTQGKDGKAFGGDFSAANTFAGEVNAEILANLGGDDDTPNGAPKCGISYRGDFTVALGGHNMGYPIIAQNAVAMDALIEAWPVIVATYRANRSKVAANYKARKAALPKGDAGIKAGTVKLDLVETVSK